MIQGSYFVPRARLEGRSAEMAFADALYGLVAEQGRPAEHEVSRALRLEDAYALTLRFAEVTQLTGLDRGTVTAELNHADREGWCRWSTIGDRDQVDVYLPGYAAIMTGMGAVHKPLAYVRNGWLHTVYRLSRSYLLQRVLNVIWLMRFDNGLRHIAVDEIRARATPRNGRPIGRSQVLNALETLEQLGVLTTQEEGYWLDRTCFDQSAPDPQAVTNRRSRSSILETPSALQLMAEDPRRLELALDVLLAGRFDPDLDLASIFQDLQWAGPEVDLLMRLARRRPKHQGAPRWADFWRNFLKYRQQHRAARERQRSALFVGRYDDARQQDGLLGVLGITADQVKGLWLVARVQGKFGTRQIAGPERSRLQVRLHVRAGTEDLLETVLDLGSRFEQQLPLTQLGDHSPLHFSVFSYTREPVPGLWLEAWLEAEPLRAAQEQG